MSASVACTPGKVTAYESLDKVSTRLAFKAVTHGSERPTLEHCFSKAGVEERRDVAAISKFEQNAACQAQHCFRVIQGDLSPTVNIRQCTHCSHKAFLRVMRVSAYTARFTQGREGHSPHQRIRTWAFP